MELKRKDGKQKKCLVIPFNRTIVELKRDQYEQLLAYEAAFNRTIVELKREMKEKKENGATLLIGPLWN